MSKFALCAKKEDLSQFRYLFNFAVADYSKLNTAHRLQLAEVPKLLIDRITCETDESLVQLLPYITIINKGKVFSYVRGKVGEENRLHDLLSIGLGGHIDTLPHITKETFWKFIEVEAQREVQEETQIIQDAFDFQYVFYDPTTPVGRVHLGLWAIVQMEEDITTELEEGIITKGKWLSLKELKDSRGQLESWSQLATELILTGEQE